MTVKDAANELAAINLHMDLLANNINDHDNAFDTCQIPVSVLIDIRRTLRNYREVLYSIPLMLSDEEDEQ